MKIRKILCLFPAVLLTAGAAAVPAHALEAGSPGSLTESFIDEATGREIAPAQVSKSPWVKEAPEIAGYEFTGFTQETRHIYSQEDLTYILGYPDKTVQGEGNLRRSEAVAIFYRLHAGAFPPLQRQMNRKTFLDVAGGAWFYKELEMCYNIGMVEGIGEHRFNPNAPVTRAEFAALAAWFASLPHSGEALFNDISPEHWAFQAINAAAKAGWVKGYPDGSFKPDSFITRAEAVSLINRMRNRSITAEELNRLGVENPYTDLVETYWAYGDLLEATVKHSAADWHRLNFSGTVNQVTERFVDENGSEIAKAVATGGAENHAHKDVKNFRYMGYAATITYVYQRGAARLAAEKGVDKTSAQVGDKLVYSVVVQNEAEATDSLKNVVLADELPAFVDFLHGSVQADGVTARHTYDHGRRKLSVGLGEIKPGQQKVITFGVTVNAAAYGQKFRNTAVISADNHTDVKASDPGVTIGPGEARLAAEKSVDKGHER